MGSLQRPNQQLINIYMSQNPNYSSRVLLPATAVTSPPLPVLDLSVVATAVRPPAGRQPLPRYAGHHASGKL